MPTRRETKPTRIVIVDDHPLIRRGMIDLLSHEPDLEVCGEAAEMTEAFQLVDQRRPDVVIIDLTLSEGSGLELIKMVKAQYPETKMVVSTMHDESLFGERCFRAGAMGYVNKDETSEKVVEAIKTVMDEKLYMSKQLADRVLQRALGTGEESSGSAVECLTDRELEVFGLIGHGLTTRQIADKLGLSHKTIEGYREIIKSKLGLKNAAELSRHAVQWSLENK